MRFPVPDPWQGWLRIPEDVTVERYMGHTLRVVSRVPADPGEILTLAHVGSAPLMAVAARVTECAPVVTDGSLRHRLRLALLNGSAGPGGPPVVAVLMKVLGVEVLEISHVGCLISMPSLLPDGTVGELQAVVDGRPCSAPITIARSFSIVSATDDVHRAAVEFVRHQPNADREGFDTLLAGLESTNHQRSGTKSMPDVTSTRTAPGTTRVRPLKLVETPDVGDGTP